MTTVDTPDYQRGVVSAQTLLASVPEGTASVTVGIPPNAKSLHVAIQFGPGVTGTLEIKGKTSGMLYPSIPVGTAGYNSFTVWYGLVSQPVDPEVEVYFVDPPTVPWWVYSDTGETMIVDPYVASTVAPLNGTIAPYLTMVGVRAGTQAVAVRSDNLGESYVIPVVPNTQAGDHPPNELLVASYGGLSSGVLVAAPASGSRIRVFSIQGSQQGSGNFSFVVAQGSGSALFQCTAGSSATLVLPPQGYALPEATELYLSVAPSPPFTQVSAYYTVETV